MPRPTRRLAPAVLAAPLFALALASVAPRPVARGDDPPTAAALARRAVDPDAAVADGARRALRGLGPAGLEALSRVHARDLARLRGGGGPARRDPALARLRAAFDQVAAQRDAHASGLYWRTDLEVAKAEARRTGRPILSLRLLGDLRDELSCANSRYFRLLLYPDPAVRELLSRRFVLHWSSERPAPVITIDMGDGRTLRRTITGNSVHYVLDAEGRPVDALVGLLTPAAFTRELDRAGRLARDCGPLPDGPRAACLARGHVEAERSLAARWEADRRALGPTRVPSAAMAEATRPTREGPGLPSATLAMRATVSKAMVETPMLQALALRPRPADPTPEWLEAVAAHRAEMPRLSNRARGLLRLKLGRADVGETEARLLELAAADSVRNEHVYHPVVHRWLAAGAPSFDELDARVYDELFLTPADDPWLGLRAPDVYDGVEIGD